MASDIISHDHMIQIGREYVWACNPLVFVLPAVTEEAHTHTHTHTHSCHITSPPGHFTTSGSQPLVICDRSEEMSTRPN